MAELRPISPRACVVCGATPVINSHLFPAAIGRDLKGNGPNFWIGTTKMPGRTISQSGLTDRFLCKKHEDAIHDYEDYAIKFIRQFELSMAELEAKQFRRDGTDNEALIRFVCSVLWRYHHSTRQETEDVDLGEWEPNFRNVTFGGSINQAPDVLMRAIHQTVMPKDAFMMTPAPTEQWGRRVLQFTVPGLVFSVKLDHGDWPEGVQRIVLNQTPNWISSVVALLGENTWRTIRRAGASMQESGSRGLAIVDHHWFELRRQSDNLIYTFRRCNSPSGQTAYKRQDGDYWITFRPALGWVAWDDATQSCMGRPWDVLADAQRDFPPEGVWVSRKAAKSYVYDLVYILAPHASA